MSATVQVGKPRTEETTVASPAEAVAAEGVAACPVQQTEGPRSERERALAWIAAMPWDQLEPRGFYPRCARPVLNLSFAILITPMACVAGLIIGCVNLAIFRDPRKILFIQPRFGRRGRVFSMFKFRTMKETSSSAHDSWRLGEDHLRVTRFGRWLRNTHLDELPQLVNILRGEMNVIGPRPEMIEIEIWAAEHVPEFARRLVLKPGITGPAQITQGYTGCEISGYAVKAAINERYRRELSLRVDLWIAVRTAVWMLSGRGWKWDVSSRAAQGSPQAADKSGTSSGR